jgi:hypothetical protein
MVTVSVESQDGRNFYRHPRVQQQEQITSSLQLLDSDASAEDFRSQTVSYSGRSWTKLNPKRFSV